MHNINILLIHVCAYELELECEPALQVGDRKMSFQQQSVEDLHRKMSVMNSKGILEAAVRAALVRRGR